MRLLLALPALLLAFVVPANADGELDRLITANDRGRLQRYELTRQKALAEARAGGERTELETLEAVIAKPALSFGDFEMTGKWRCRTIKVGGLLPLVVYDWFACRVTDDASGWRLEKTSGSQRTTGRFYTDSDTRLVYLGSFSVNDDKPLPYGSGKETDQVGYAFRTGATTFRLEFPEPFYESSLDIIELRR